MNFIIATSHPRVIKAKYKMLFASKTLRNVLAVIGVLSLLIGIGFIFTDYSFGWFVLILPILLFISHEWYHNDLLLLEPIEGSDAPEDILQAELLAYLPTEAHSLDELLPALQKSSDFWFIANRCSVHPELLSAITVSDTWWQKSLELYKNQETKNGLNAAHIITALIVTSPDKAAILSQTKNSEEDILACLEWHEYLQYLLASMSERQNTGGIARDWAVGYTPLLDSYAVNISRSIQYGGVLHREVIGHKNVVAQMNAIFTSNGRANIALVGDVGVGKSTCIQAFAESLLFNNASTSVAYNQIYQIDITALLTKVVPEKLDYTIQRLCTEAYQAKNIVLYFDNAGAFFGAGGSVDATNSILPIIEAGRVRMIFSFTQQDWQYIQRAKSQIGALLNYQAVLPTNEHDTIKILENQALFTESQYKAVFTYGSLKEVYRLANRYGPEIAMPGRAISVLEDVARSNQNDLIQKINVQKTIEQSTGIKIVTSDATDKSALLSLEDKLKERVVGQDVAIKEIVSALKRSRTGIANPNKPIGTFLFLGPTGVGKTEMSKALADIYFGGKSGFVRVDMNEYITQDSIHKLLSSSTESGSSFMETIRRQPFSVVLLDEIEKAHPDIINTLLQLLDEGEIKDNDNRTVSFKDAIIIATTNAGAEEIRTHIQADKQVQELEHALPDMLISKGIFKPEFINRFDGIIIFSPLTQEKLRDIIAILLKETNNTLQSQGITVTLSEDAVAWLISQGYDERLGARPLRRMMQKTVETAVSNILLEQEVQHGSTITLTAQNLQSV